LVKPPSGKCCRRWNNRTRRGVDSWLPADARKAPGEALGINKSTSKRYDDGSIPVIPLSIELAIEALEARWKKQTAK
jgi:hypothetical protein